MPHANIWIRKENEDRWESIKDKSEFVNKSLGHAFGVKKLEALDYKSKDPLPSLKACKHPNVNKRTGICPDCGEYTR